MSDIKVDALYKDVLVSTDAQLRVDALYKDVLVSTDAQLRVGSVWVDVLVSAFDVEDMEVTVRFEDQKWDAILLSTELVQSGVGQTGLTVTGVLRRRSDNLYLQSGGGWGASPSTLSFTEPSSANMPGLYTYTVDPDDLSWEDGEDGYLVSIGENTLPFRQNVHISVASSMSEARMLGLRQSNMIIVDATYSSAGLPTSGSIYLYQDNATATSDYSLESYSNALESYTYTVENDVQGRRTRYLSVRD